MAEETPDISQDNEASAVAQETPDEDAIEAEMLAALEESELQSSDISSDDRLKNILAMRVPLIVKVAQKKMCMENVLKLSLGSIIQFDKDVYENIELMVNNQAIGLGQPVKIGENFGLRLLQVGKLENTIKSLGGK